MNTTSLGKEAEDLVSKYLKDKGYEIIKQNWRTRYCEIDIIAKKDKAVYFVEVKYRKINTWGDGFDAITKTKQKQMQYAAEMWVASNNWQGDSMLMAASVTGEPLQIAGIIEI